MANTLPRECFNKSCQIKLSMFLFLELLVSKVHLFCAQVNEALQRPKVKFGQKFDTEEGLASKGHNVDDELDYFTMLSLSSMST